MTLTDARVGDPRIAVVETFGTLDSNGESELPETYVLSQVDIDAGRVENTAAATETRPVGRLATSRAIPVPAAPPSTMTFRR